MRRRSVLMVIAGLVLLLVVLLLPSAALAAPTEAWVTSQITSNSLNDSQPAISGDRIAWLRSSSSTNPVTAVYTWSPLGGIVQLASNSYGDGPRVSGDRVVWSSSDGHDFEIYTWTPASGTVRLTTNSYSDIWPDVSGDRVVWAGADQDHCFNVFTWTPGGGTVKLTTDIYCQPVHVSGDRAVWYVSSEAGIDPQPGIFTWTPAGGVQRLTTGSGGHDPVVSGDRVVWGGFDGDIGIYTWTPGGGAVKVDSKAWSNGHAEVSGDRIVWNRTDGGDFDNFTWTPGSGVVQLTSDGADQGKPQVFGDRVVWADTDGSRWLYCWTPEDGTVRLPSGGLGSWGPAVSGDRVVWSGGDGVADSEIFTAVAYPVTVPKITSIDPASAPTTGGTAVVINGSGFLNMSGAAAVKFGSTNATSYTVNSPTKITAVAPAHAAGKVDVTVTAAGGTSAGAGTGDDFLYLTRYEQADSRFAYTGTWTVSSTTSASGGSFRFCNAAGSVTVSFNGTYLAWIAKQSPVYGKAKVTLDDQAPVEVDLHGASTLYKRAAWNTGTLPSGVHTVKIEWTGTKNASATGTNIGVDAFDILGTAVQAQTTPGTTRYEQGDTHLGYTGTWLPFSATGASAGSYLRASTDASVTAKFSGTYLAWIATKGTTLGQAFVSLDGGAAQRIDLTRSSVAYQQKVWDTGTLAAGEHTVKIWRDPANATGRFVGVDAFDVKGTLLQVETIPSTARYEQTAAALSYGGTWITSTVAAASGGTFKYANASGASVTVPFTGTSLSWIAKQSPAYGKAKVTVDGGAPAEVDLYDGATLYQRDVWESGELASGLHWVKIEWTGTKNASATDTNIGLDAVEVMGSLTAATRLEQTQAKLVYAGTWTTSTVASASGGDFKFANKAGASVTVRFTGISCNLIAKKSSVYGIAEIKLDDQPAVLVDFYSSSTLYKHTVWKSGFLTPGDHTVTIKWTGKKRAAASDYNINLDAADVIGTLR